MKIHCLYDKLVPTSELKPHPFNRNRHPSAQIARLAEILEFQGWRYPIKVSKRSGLITSGHGRLEAARLKNWESVPVNFQDYESEEQEYADVQADNAIASWSELDLSAINSDLGNLGPDFNIDLLGIKDFVLEPADKLEPQCDEDEVPEAVEPKTKRGDIYQLGRHRLMCGDSTSIDDVEKLMAGEKADMVFTDPPYIGMVGAEWDKQDLDWDALFSNLLIVTEDNCNIVITGQTPIIFTWYPKLLERFRFVQDMVWVKQRAMNLNQTTFARQHENILWFCKGDKYFDADKSRTETDTYRRVKRSDPKMMKGAPTKLKGGVTEGWGYTAQSVFEFGRVYHQNEEYVGHPTQKPTELVIYLLESLSPSQCRVLDFFGGSGSTIISCEKSGRSGFSMELDPHYCDVIVARWEKYTGQKAVLLNG